VLLSVFINDNMKKIHWHKCNVLYLFNVFIFLSMIVDGDAQLCST